MLNTKKFLTTVNPNRRSRYRNTVTALMSTFIRKKQSIKILKVTIKYNN